MPPGNISPFSSNSTKSPTKMSPSSEASGWVKLLAINDQFLGVGEILEDGRLSPKRLIRHASSCV